MPAFQAWSGLAFEAVCYKHISNIRKALNIGGAAIAGTWRFIPGKNSTIPGAQIDLVFDRNDGMVSLCEIKYTSSLFKIDKDYAKVLERKREAYQAATKTTKQIVISMITTYGLAPSDYADDLVFSSCTMDALFAI